MVMDEGDEGEERRRKAKELGESAKKAVKQGGSSYLNTTWLIQHVMQQQLSGGLLVVEQLRIEYLNRRWTTGHGLVVVVVRGSGTEVVVVAIRCSWKWNWSHGRRCSWFKELELWPSLGGCLVVTGGCRHS
ncbi:hypothetical protein Pint_35777 [Pistacia integerrima]|uniref:Uncharacterized protein n=1 Tax=Pistacia integerrima TaxID=434235 RepID=A0ACC0Y3H8_9ROSI|nr:hypothetical protein Pint_35777 [Pistacia integerrima]